MPAVACAAPNGATSNHETVLYYFVIEDCKVLDHPCAKWPVENDREKPLMRVIWCCVVQGNLVIAEQRCA